ncbi:MAG: N-acetylmuramoyl-L-alanine amidase [Clostridia bacterium]|nr:N-acetylmuramoyl-L-alanine amidase [Clostridia bacterium]
MNKNDGLTQTKSHFTPIKEIIISLSLVFIPMLVILFFINSFSAAKLVQSTTNGTSRTVIIDAGHGGEDGGAVGKGGVVEKDINLPIAMKTAESLKKSGYDVVLTRDGDYAVYSEEARTLREKKVSDIHNRFAIIEDSGDCIFVSIHMNHFDSAYVCGAQTFYSGNNPESKKLADSVQSAIKTLVQPENERVTKKATSSIYLLYYAQVPAIMVECGFISNENEAAKLQTTEYQNQMAAAIAEGINHYYNGLQ